MDEVFLSAGVVAYDVSVAEEFVLVGEEAFEAYGASGVDFGGGDAYFGAEAVAEAVGEAGACVLVDVGAVDQGHEFLGCFCVLGEDAVGVVGAVGIDVIDGFIDTAYDLQGDDEVDVFMMEGFAFRDDLHGSDFVDFFCAPQFHAGVPQRFGKARKEIFGDVPVDQDGLDGVAGCRVLCLGIDDEGNRSFLVIFLIDVDVADAVGMAEDGDVRMVHDVLDECVRASWNQEVDGVVAFEEFVDFIVLLCLEEAVFRKACVDGCLMDEGEKDAVRPRRFLAAFQDGAVAALQAQGGNLDEGIGACFEDDADDADWAGDAVEREALVEFASKGDIAERIRKRHEACEFFGDVRKLRFVEFEAFLDRSRDACFLGKGQVFSIGFEDFFFMRIQRFADEGERLVSRFKR